MDSLESIILSTPFTILLAVVGLYLFALITREFCLWFFRINKLNARLKTIELKLEKLTEKIEQQQQNTASVTMVERKATALTSLAPVSKDDQKENFPFTH